LSAYTCNNSDTTQNISIRLAARVYTHVYPSNLNFIYVDYTHANTVYKE